jgi:hypothetical protein
MAFEIVLLLTLSKNMDPPFPSVFLLSIHAVWLCYVSTRLCNHVVCMVLDINDTLMILIAVEVKAILQG